MLQNLFQTPQNSTVKILEGILYMPTTNTHIAFKDMTKDPAKAQQISQQQTKINR